MVSSGKELQILIVLVSETPSSHCSSPSSSRTSCLMGAWHFWGRWLGSVWGHWTRMKAFLPTRTAYDNINGPGGPFMLDIIGPVRPLMYTWTKCLVTGLWKQTLQSPALGNIMQFTELQNFAVSIRPAAGRCLFHYWSGTSVSLWYTIYYKWVYEDLWT